MDRRYAMPGIFNTHHSNYHLQGLICTQKLTNHDESDATIVPITDSHTN